MCVRSSIAGSALALCITCPVPAWAQSANYSQALSKGGYKEVQDTRDDLSAKIEAYAGQDVVPPDIIESIISQDRLEPLFGLGAELTYRKGNTRVVVDANAEFYPDQSIYNRYTLGGSISQDIPLSRSGRTRVRLGGGYEYIFGDSGRVFDRVRADAQLIVRQNPEHTSVARLRYGHRNQSEERFTGFDQDEWLLELRHDWRPNSGPGLISGSLMAVKHEADAERFSYDGYGFRVLGRVPINDGWAVLGRLSVVQREFKAPFSPLYTDDRSDTHIRASVGAERSIGENLVAFAQAGYVANPSNIPVRDYDGFFGTIGLRWQID